MKAFLFLLLSFSITLTKKSESTPILKIARSVDQNEVHYFVKTDKNGNLHSDEPIKLLWKSHKKGGTYEELNWIKKKYGYGVKILSRSKERTYFQFVAYNKKQFYLQKNKSGNYAIFADFDQKEVELASFFVNIQGGSFWTPNVVSVDVLGREVNSQSKYHGEIRP